MMNRDDLYNKLLNMLEVTTPSPNDIILMEKFLPKGGTWVKDNYIYTIGNSETMFACHIDTVGKEPMYTDVVYKKGKLYTGNKDVRCLGGDDRCGMLSLLALIDAGVPGTYVFHTSEERGAISANDLAKSGYDFSQFKRAIEFDRRGTDSIITEMSGDRVCSEKFADELGKQLNLGYKSDPTGLFTDVYIYKYLIPEVTNLSVGYMFEHRNSEEIEVLWLIDNFIPAIVNVDWESLPVSRDHKRAEREEFVAYYRTERMSKNAYGGAYSSSYRSIYDLTSNDYDGHFNLLNDEKSWDSKNLEDDLEKYDAFGSCDSCGQADFLFIRKYEGACGTFEHMICSDCVEVEEEDSIDDCNLCGNTDFVTDYKDGLNESYRICSDCLIVLNEMNEAEAEAEAEAEVS